MLYLHYVALYSQVQNLETNFCPFCKNRLPLEGETFKHKSKCREKVQRDIISGGDNSIEKSPG